MLAAMNPSLRRGDATTPPEVGPAPAAKRVCAELTPVQQGEINNTIKTRRPMRGFGYLLYIRFACQKKSDMRLSELVASGYVQSLRRARLPAMQEHKPSPNLSFSTTFSQLRTLSQVFTPHPLIANRSFGK
ncbi:MAG: hypothetical protein DMG73_00965 [Acidobacteria bacterium]|nr:MAG: hypothetical protein DMG73_00965 [Acidobacteriota bacterium]